METRRLEYFVRIVEFGSITKAAAQIGIAQPALSQQLAILEADFKTKLLTRTAQGVEPTPAGTELYRQARIVLRQIDLARQLVKRTDASPAGNVSIGLPTSAATVLALPILETTRNRYPDIRLQVIEGLSGPLRELVMNARLDLALLFQAEPTAGLLVEPLWNEDLLLIGPPEANLPERISIRKAAALPLLMPAHGNGARMVLNAVLAKQYLEPEIVAEVDSIFTLKKAVQRGLGFTFLPWSAVHQEVEQHLLNAVAIDDTEIYRTVSLCTPASMPTTTVMDCTAAIIRELTNEILESKSVRGMRSPAERR